MQTNPESAAVEAVANMTPAKFTARLADGSLILCVTEAEHTQIVNANKSALDALRREVADRDAVIECKNIDIRERDRSLHEWAERAKAAERRVAELEADARRYRYLRDDAFKRSDMTPAVIVADAQFDIDSEHTEGFMFGDELDAAIDALTKESP